MVDKNDKHNTTLIMVQKMQYFTFDTNLNLIVKCTQNCGVSFS